MIIIADSGSSKTDWRIIYNNSSVVSAVTEGINPVYRTSDEIIAILWNKLLKQIPVTSDFNNAIIHFYGAGVLSSEYQRVFRECFQSIFPGAEVFVESDMLAAARSVCGTKAGIVCVLGTGSNSCMYDGKEIIDNVKAGGYILGDEGSGAYIGKMLLSDYLKELMPENVYTAFKERYHFDYATIVDKVYREEMPSKFLASFTYFVKDFIDDSYIKGMVGDAFDLFYRRNVIRFNIAKYEAGFVGSVAKTFEHILRERAVRNGIRVGKIIQNPIDGLVNYYTKNFK